MQGTTTTLKGDSPYPIQDLGPLTGTPQEVYEKAETLVDIFRVLCDKDELELRNDMFGYTDCATFVAANFNDPEAFLTVEHELSHIYFDSDLVMGELYREIIVDEMLQMANVSATKTEAAALKQVLNQLVHNIWNCLEDHRVRSLWEEIYPGGGYFLEKRWENVATHCMKDSACDNLLSYIARVSAIEKDDDINAPEPFKLCKQHIIDAKTAVYKTDKKTCLAMTKQLILDISSTILDWVKINDQPLNKSPLNPNQTYEENLENHAKSLGSIDPDKSLNDLSKEKQDALGKILQLTAAAEGGSNKDDNSRNFNAMGAKDVVDAPDSEKRKKRVTGEQRRLIKRISKMATLAKQGDKKAEKELEKLVQKGASEMKKKIKAAKAALMGGSGEDPEEADKVEYESAARAAGINAVVVKNPNPLPKPSKGSDKVKKELEKVRMARKTKLHEEGDDLDIESFIEAKLYGELQDAKIFRDTTSEPGLDLLLLADCSGSMWGNGIQMVDQAIADIQNAIKHLKVKCHLWSFSNSLYVYPKIGSIGSAGGGGTDLCPALDSALEWAKSSKADRGIIMLTDGLPTSCRRRNSTGKPIQDMFNMIKEAQADGIVLSILVINEGVSEWVQCSNCGNHAEWMQMNTTIECPSCKSPITLLDSVYDTYFGKGNYSVVGTRKDIEKQLPLCARALVLNHIKKH